MTDPELPPDDGSDPGAASGVQVPAAPAARARRVGSPGGQFLSKAQLVVLALGVLAASNLASWIEIGRLKAGPDVSVVGVRQMTQDYVNKIAGAPISSQESVVRAQLFTAAAQEEVQRLAPGHHRLVLARECVLAGDRDDLTAQIQSAVEARLAAVTAGLSNLEGSVSPSLNPALAPTSARLARPGP